MRIDIEPAFDLPDLLCCGMIRNACRDYMTANVSEVTYEQQEQISIAWKEGWSPRVSMRAGIQKTIEFYYHDKTK